jgi:hypothetical protein
MALFTLLSPEDIEGATKYHNGEHLYFCTPRLPGGPLNLSLRATCPYQTPPLLAVFELSAGVEIRILDPTALIGRPG